MARMMKDEKVRFINPYNFISTTSTVDRKPLEEGNLTGYISCSVKVKELLVIPDREKEVVAKTDKHGPTYNFYTIGGKPVIPGSELRGCIRSVFEAITPSCFSVINSDTLSNRAKPSANIKPGLLKRADGKWKITPAEYERMLEEPAPNEQDYDFKRRWRLFSSEIKRIQKKHPQLREFKNVKFTSVKMCSFYFFELIDPDFECSDKDVDKLRRCIEIYRDNLTEGGKKELKGDAKEQSDVYTAMLDTLERMRTVKDSDEMIPMFYEKLESGKIVYISAANTGRNVFNNTVLTLLDKHVGCTGKDGYCPACSLFGTLGNNMPIASRLRFTDATTTEEEYRYTKDYLVLPELSSPKISSVEFYSLPGNTDKLKEVEKWNYDTEGVILRGRKFYFHSPAQPGEKFGPRQIKVKAVTSGSVFRFKLYFDRISDLELRQLLWVLTLGENDADGKMMHKLGTGRPVGYGSVKMTVDGVTLRELNGVDGYGITTRDYNSFGISDELFFEKAALHDLKLITDYGYAERYKVSYPIADDGKNNDNSKAAHQWFSENRAHGNRFTDALPILSDDAELLLLPSYKGSNNGNGGNNGNRNGNNGNHNKYGGNNGRNGKWQNGGKRF